MADEQVQAQAAKGPKTVTFSVKALLNDLKNGIDRKQMAEKYGVTQAAITEAFKDDRLKGKRVIHPGVRTGVVRKKYNVVLVDDEEGTSTENIEQPTENIGEVSQENTTEATAEQTPELQPEPSNSPSW